MKYIRYILFFGIACVSLWSCKEDDLNPIVNLNSAPVITAPTAGNEIVLLEAEANELLPAFTWTAADFGFQSGTTYHLQIDLDGNNFSTPTTLVSRNALEAADLTQEELNTFLIGRGLEGGVAVDMEIRVVASISGDVASLVSASVPVTITPYATSFVHDQLQVPGSYQGWDPSNNSTIIYSAQNDGKYEGYLFFQDADSKFKYTRGLSWDVNWGDDGADGTLEPNGFDITAGAAGLYRLQVNLTALTHSFELTNWGLIGSATPGGWDSDQDMIYDPVSGKVSITLDLVAGEIKFRANDDWAFNYGDNDNNKSLDINGSNIVIAEAGNYTIDLLIVREPKLKYAITKN